jgi:KipI family sensor histidine kinase inhibitor
VRRWRPAGDAALLLQVEGLAARLAVAILTERVAGVLDVVPAARTVLVTTEPGSNDLGELAGRLLELPLPPDRPGETALAEIAVVYDGPDLAEVAQLTGLSPGEVVTRHTAGEYTVGWLGFSPGFGYLTGLDPVLASVPRLAEPRLRVPAGSVAIAGGLAAVYPNTSPGGWRLLGRTSAALWDPDRNPPTLLAPGMRVRFRRVDALADVAAPAAPRSAPPTPSTPPANAPPDHQGARAPAAARTDQQAVTSPPPAPSATPVAGQSSDFHNRGSWSPNSGRYLPRSWKSGPAIEVIKPGPLATVQDLGRPGYGHLGVPRSGAADVASLRLANRLVGNPDGAAGIEFTLGRAALRFPAGARVAVTGAPVPLTVEPRTQEVAEDGPGSTESDPPGDTARGVTGKAATNLPGDTARGVTGGAAAGVMPHGSTFEVPAGSVLRVGAPPAGVRSYLAVRGGVGVPLVLGSRSADLRSGLGPAALRPGDVLPVGAPGPVSQLAAEAPGPASPMAAEAPGPASPMAAEAPGPASPMAAEATGVQPTAMPVAGETAVLHVVPGPREDWFAPDALRELCAGTYVVTPASDRTGLRLDGPALPFAGRGELLSEGVVTGALQVPHGGRPILLLADHPVTGGYPVIATVVSADIGLAAQLRPGSKLRFTLAARDG